MGSSRVISGPKSGAGIVKAGGPGSAAKKVTPKPAGGNFMNSVHTSASTQKVKIANKK